MGEAISPRGEDHADRFCERAGQSADGEAGSFKGRQRGLGLAAGAVIAFGRDMQVERRAAEGQEDCQKQRRTERHGHPDKTRPGRFPQDFLAT